MARWSFDSGLILLYVFAIVLANGLVTTYGQPALVVTAFVLIPFDLVVRDLLQDRWQGRYMWWGWMAVLVLGGSLISYFTTVASERIAVASMTAFVLTGALDAMTYQWAIRLGRLFRINFATLIAAFTDSIVFALLAFDDVDNWLVVSQAGSKILGGVVWSLLLYRLFKKRGSRGVQAS